MARFAKSLLIALGLSLALGLAIGTCLRREAEAPARYIGHLEEAPPSQPPAG